MSLHELMQAEQRLLTLRFLLDDVDRRHNENILRTALRSLGHAMNFDQCRILIQWLKDAGCVTVEELDALWIVTLTNNGAEVVRAERTIPGIAHPHDTR